jgi:hypothetical protein
MSSVVINFCVPVLTALAIGFFRPRDAFVWSWVTLAPDLDYFTWNMIPGVPNMHRALLHNGLILGGLLAGTGIAYARQRRLLSGLTARDFFLTSKGAAWSLSSFYYFAHILLDVFAGGIAPFFPFSRLSWSFDFFILINTQTNQPTLEGGPTTQPGIPQVSPVYEWLSSEQSGIVLILVAAALWVLLVKRPWRRVIVVPAARRDKV